MMSRNIKIKIYKIIIFSSFLCVSDLVSHINGRLRVFANRVLRGIPDPKGEEVSDAQRKLTTIITQQNYQNKKIMEDVIGRACRIHKNNEKSILCTYNGRP